MSLFTIQDSNGYYVSKYSLWHDEKMDEWYYAPRDTYKGLRLCNSEDEAQDIIDDIKKNIHKVENVYVEEFFIKEII